MKGPECNLPYDNIIQIARILGEGGHTLCESCIKDKILDGASEIIGPKGHIGSELTNHENFALLHNEDESFAESPIVNRKMNDSCNEMITLSDCNISNSNVEFIVLETSEYGENTTAAKNSNTEEMSKISLRKS